MAKQLFTIEFFYRETRNLENKRTKVCKYSATINLISENFQLFHVSNIRKMDKEVVLELIDSYLITSYPYNKVDNKKWKDASTLESNSFVSTLGVAIEQSIYTVAFPA